MYFYYCGMWGQETVLQGHSGSLSLIQVSIQIRLAILPVVPSRRKE